MKKTITKTETYSMGGGFYVDISTKKDYMEAFIYEKDGCIKLFMFGMWCMESTFIECVKSNFKLHKAYYLETLEKYERMMESEVL